MANLEQLIDRAIRTLPEHALTTLEQKKREGKQAIVYVGMSGGVDSSVSAYLLKRAGFDVRGVFIKVWQPEDIDCTWKEDRRDAMRVSAVLGIPFQTIYLEDQYKRYVADYMINEYRDGRTPNPDIMCNKYVKFGAYYEAAMEAGADFIATGHYARTRTIRTKARGIDSEENNFPQTEMLVAKDENKDQTYFLWATEGRRLSRMLFPVGSLFKDDVRLIAEYADLPTFAKKDSQGVCFIGKFDMKEFLQKYLHTKQGKVLDLDGNEIGVHDGALLYTIGERHGFEIWNSSPETAPRFVIEKNIEENILVVGSEKQLISKDRSKKAVLCNVNFLSKDRGTSSSIKARIRHRQKLQGAKVEPFMIKQNDGSMDIFKIDITFKEPQQGLASGQSCVLYDGEICLGGGIIE